MVQGTKSLFAIAAVKTHPHSTAPLRLRSNIYSFTLRCLYNARLPPTTIFWGCLPLPRGPHLRGVLIV